MSMSQKLVHAKSLYRGAKDTPDQNKHFEHEHDPELPPAYLHTCLLQHGRGVNNEKRINTT